MSDGIYVKFRGGEKLDRALSKIANLKQSKATSIVNSSLSAGATQVKKSIASVTPVAKKDTTGFKLSSRNITKGQLKRSLKSGLRKKVNVGRNVFLAGVWFQTKKGGAPESKDGFFAKQVLERHSPNAFGYTGGNNFLSKGIRTAEPSFKNKLGSSLAKKIAAFGQAEINKLR